MNVIIASHNPVKIDAVKRAFSERFPSEPVLCRGVDADSGVNAQPVGDSETLQGAQNRVVSAKQIGPNADYWVGIEGGVFEMHSQLFTFAWIVVERSDGNRGRARTATLPLPDRIKQLVDSGLELGVANDQVFSTRNSKQQGGAFGLLTDGRYTRADIYAQGTTIALIPVLHELYT